MASLRPERGSEGNHAVVWIFHAESREGSREDASAAASAQRRRITHVLVSLASSFEMTFVSTLSTGHPRASSLAGISNFNRSYPL
jgi:hypothetical protein